MLCCDGWVSCVLLLCCSMGQMELFKNTGLVCRSQLNGQVYFVSPSVIIAVYPGELSKVSSDISDPSINFPLILPLQPVLCGNSEVPVNGLRVEHTARVSQRLIMKPFLAPFRL